MAQIGHAARSQLAFCSSLPGNPVGSRYSRNHHKSGAKPAACHAVFDGTDYWLADGFHRFWAAKEAGLTEIYEEIHPGTLRDAILFSLSANSKHGLRRTNADKRKAVQTLLDDPSGRGGAITRLHGAALYPQTLSAMCVKSICNRL